MTAGLTLRPTWPVERVELPDGLELDYVDQGDRDGVPVVFLHGITDSWRSFEPVMPHLPASLRGHPFGRHRRPNQTKRTVGQTA
jgi:pimeloyl-ACP methyl ester carboxylesterase